LCLILWGREATLFGQNLKGAHHFGVYNWIFINKFLKNLFGESYVMPLAPLTSPLCIYAFYYEHISQFPVRINNE
jgi:hypothetical protein